MAPDRPIRAAVATDPRYPRRMSYYAEKNLAGRRLQRVYELATPRKKKGGAEAPPADATAGDRNSG